jgi:hypothetical protein
MMKRTVYLETSVVSYCSSSSEPRYNRACPTGNYLGMVGQRSSSS